MQITKHKSWKKRKKQLFFLLYVMVVSTGAVEIIARVALSDFTDNERYYKLAFARLLNSAVVFDKASENRHKTLGYLHSPHAEKHFTQPEFSFTARTNSLGFRTKELKTKEKDEYRVLLLGDSFFWGEGVDADKMIDAHLERFARELPSRSKTLNVFNYAVAGYNTVQELIVLRTFGQQVNPDHIIVGFDVANDAIPNAIAHIDADGNYAVSAEKLAQTKQRMIDLLSPMSWSVAARVPVLTAYVPRARYMLSIKDDVIGHTYTLLKEMRDRSVSLGARFTVVIIYPRDGVQGDLVQAWSQSRRVGELVVAFCNENGIDTINLLDHMIGKQDREQFFYARDGHYTARGNERVAQAILSSTLTRFLNEAANTN